ncbi:MAG: SDR family NAD(P)-dependent oxidoreductase, partial [Bacteroidota bacterium]|nr:SDR family NAD(P)-dependent oxidoreductase [Bacteroidota bacterium]
MDLGLKGKTAVITGGSRGIGLAIAHSLGNEGCRLLICARGQEQLDAAVQDLQA